MKILITGINGLLGNVLVRRLIEKHEIFALVKKNKEKIVHKNLKIIETDLKFFNEKKLPKKIDFIIHLAQSNFYNNFPEKGKDIFDVNISATFNLLNFAYKNKIKNGKLLLFKLSLYVCDIIILKTKYYGKC